MCSVRNGNKQTPQRMEPQLCCIANTIDTTPLQHPAAPTPNSEVLYDGGSWSKSHTN